MCRLVTHKVLRESWAGHTQRVNTDVGWSHTKGYANAVDVLLQCQCFVQMDSEVFNRRFERNTVSINVCTLTVDRFKTRCRPYRHNLSLICVQLNIVAIHPQQNTINIYLNTGLKRNELIGWCTFGQLSVIDVRVTITVMEDRNHI